MRISVLVIAGALAINPGYPQAPAGPDVAGFRPGMTVQDAYRALKAYNPKAQIKAQEITVPEIGNKPLPQTLQLSENGEGSSEVIEVSITLPPGPQVVYKVVRVLNFAPGKELTEANALAALREKYGQDFSFGQNNPQRIWLFDQQGRRAQDAGGLYAQCALPGHPKYAPGLGQVFPPYSGPEAMTPACIPLIRVQSVVMRATDGSGRITQLLVALTNVGLARRAEEATFSHILNVQGAQSKQVLDKAQQQGKPKL